MTTPNNTEAYVVEQWIYKTLTSSAEITGLVGTRVYPYLVPEGSAYPAVVYAPQAPTKDIMAVGTIRIASNALYTIKVITKHSPSELLSPGTADSIYAKIDALLHSGSGQVSSGNVFGATRIGEISVPVVDGDKRYMQRGGVYRIMARAT